MVSNPLNKTSYYKGESLDLTGLVITLYYDNGTFGEIENYEVSGFDAVPGTKTITVSFEGFTTTFEVIVLDYKPGDINGDKTVDVKDLIALRKYLASWDITVITVALDINKDDDVNVRDVIHLAKHIALWSGYENLE